MKDRLIVVTGAGGFIGGHLVADLRRQNYGKIRAVDIKPLDEWYQRFDDVENLSLDLNLKETYETVCKGAHQVFNLAANIGSMDFIKKNKALCMLSGNLSTDIWGDGHQTRSFMYIDDCVEGVQKIQNSQILEPINLGSSELVSINHLVDIAEDIGGVKARMPAGAGH